MREVSLKTLSRQLGLTEGTVSRALNGYTDISSKTRTRVREAAVELGYHPNLNARRLATGNAECVAYVMPWRMAHISDPFLGELLDGISEALARRQWDLTVTLPRSSEDEIAAITRLAKSGRVNGVVISRTLVDDPRVDMLRTLGLPFITHGRTAQSDDHAWFDVDNFSAMHDATVHLAGLGHRRIAHVHGPLEYNFARERLDGYRAGLANSGLQTDTSLEVGSEGDVDCGYRAMQALLAGSPTPTAVVCVTDMVAIGAMKAIREDGLTPGREISVIGYDGISIGEHTCPALTTMAQPLQQAGKTIADMLLAVIDGASPATLQRALKAELVRRQTDNPPQDWPTITETQRREETSCVSSPN